MKACSFDLSHMAIDIYMQYVLVECKLFTDCLESTFDPRDCKPVPIKVGHATLATNFA